MTNVSTRAGDAVWRGVACLGCGEKVSARRDPYVVFNGLKDGSLLVVTHAEPGEEFATWPSVPASLTLYQLGIAHRYCIDGARQRLEAGEGPADVLPTVDPSIMQESPVRLDLPPGADCCPFCEDCTELNDEDALPLVGVAPAR